MSVDVSESEIVFYAVSLTALLLDKYLIHITYVELMFKIRPFINF